MYTAHQLELVGGYGDFLHRWPWDHYAAFTFSRPGSQSGCVRTWHRFIDRLGRLTRGRVGWIRTDELRWSGVGKPEIPLHYHALLMFQRPAAPQAVADLWKSRAGDAYVEPYNPGKGGAWYESKLLVYPTGNWDLGGLEFFKQEGNLSGQRG